MSTHKDDIRKPNRRKGQRTSSSREDISVKYEKGMGIGGMMLASRGLVGKREREKSFEILTNYDDAPSQKYRTAEDD